MTTPGDSSGDWSPTHVVPADGLPAWEHPDPASEPAATLDGGLPVQLDAQEGGWARVVCSNGWVCWLDGARLETLPEAAPDSPHDAPAVDESSSQSVADFIGSLSKPGNGPMATVVVLLATVLCSLLLWPLLRIPGELVGAFLPTGGNCVGETPQTLGMYLCSAKIGLFRALGGFVALVVAIVFRRPLMAWLRPRLPKGSSVLVGPVLATLMFGLVHSASHADTGSQSGLVSQRVFPAVVGMFVFGAGRLGPTIARRFSGALTSRDKIPGPVRLLLALAIPFLLAYVTMNENRVSDTARKEQVVILATMGTGFVALLPRDGNFGQAGGRLLDRAGRRISRRVSREVGQRMKKSGKEEKA